eukprot:GHVL01044061.1.p2 GENE.GHVL01044061.1~~GHVL01044061.1.p2  ORF type:complete len:126 (-),score=34.15 GHVL01044061.1:694-1071(-)
MDHLKSSSEMEILRLKEELLESSICKDQLQSDLDCIKESFSKDDSKIKNYENIMQKAIEIIQSTNNIEHKIERCDSFNSKHIGKQESDNRLHELQRVIHDLTAAAGHMNAQLSFYKKVNYIPNIY